MDADVRSQLLEEASEYLKVEEDDVVFNLAFDAACETVAAAVGKFDENSAVKFTADNLDDDVLMEVLKTLYGNCDLEAGLNPAMGERNIALGRM